MKQRTFSVAAIVALLFGLWLLQSDGFRDLDLFATRTAAHWRSPMLTTGFRFFTELGRALVAFIWCVLAFRRSASMGLRLTLAVSGSWVACEIVKFIVQRPRPIEILPLVHETSYSFPSGHSCVAAATYSTLAVLLCRNTESATHRTLIRVSAAAIVTLIATSRVYLGVHYLTDVVAGVLLGLATAYPLLTIGRGNTVKS